MNNEHTPGPWTERDCEVQAADGSSICEMLAREEDVPKWGRDHADANSRLICAAPDLLKALERTLGMALGWADEAREEAPGRGEHWPWVMEARAAIYKAKGTKT
tara:strand:+ start:45313 stop:45624 length:312 start_codon:yes stop_codon:yes gene_type:complete